MDRSSPIHSRSLSENSAALGLSWAAVRLSVGLRRARTVGELPQVPAAPVTPRSITASRRAGRAGRVGRPPTESPSAEHGPAPAGSIWNCRHRSGSNIRGQYRTICYTGSNIISIQFDQQTIWLNISQLSQIDAGSDHSQTHDCQTKLSFNSESVLLAMGMLFLPRAV